MWLRWFQLGTRFLRDRLNPDPMHRLGLGLLFGLLGIFLQSTTEWTYRQSSIMFTLHVMMGALASLCYVKRQAVVAARKEARAERLAALEAEAVPIVVSTVRMQR